ncbi:hypothetical protein [Halorubrum sp. F4]|uniref:hypothetical protein n=1 Tax=Halorubrum sp. F4 TaxID=2989715 RepID=UPI0024803F53|nr:hypothetical protein [Halorubrum sp. F4]
MKPADDLILEYVQNVGEVPPVVIDRNVDIHSKYVGERCRELTDYGLLNRLEGGYYSINSQGKKYLQGYLDAENLEPFEES